MKYAFIIAGVLLIALTIAAGLIWVERRLLALFQDRYYNVIVEALRELRLLPALFFLKSRYECDRALDELDPSPLDPDADGFALSVREHIESYPELKSQRQLDRLLECRAGSHGPGGP